MNGNILGAHASDKNCSPRKPRLLLITGSVGTGHNQAAQAIQAGMNATAPEIEVNYTDVLDHSARLFRAKYVNGYTLMVTKFPTMYGLGFAWTDRHNTASRTLSEKYRLRSESQALRKFSDFVRQYDPDLIVNTHLLAPPVIANLQRLGQIKAPQWILITDVMPHRWWYCENVERWFVLQEESQNRLLRWGIEQEKITVSGMPVQPKWNEQLPERAELLKQLRLPADKKIILLSGGAAFTCGPIVKVARQLVAHHPDTCVVTLAGRNKNLLGKLSGLAEARTGQIVPVGFTDCMHKFVEAASLVITKAGGMITAECLAKSTPMIILKPVPGQELDNARFFARKGSAMIAKNTKQTIQTVDDLLNNPDRLKEMTQNAAALYKPARQTITDAICQKLMNR